MINFFAIFLFVLIVCFVVSKGVYRPSFLFGFLIFFFLQFGPHTLIFSDWLLVAKQAGLSEDIYVKYSEGLLVSYLTIFLTIILINKKVLTVNDIRPPGVMDKTKIGVKKSLVVGFFLIIIGFVFSYQNGEIKEQVSFIFGGSDYTYEEIRRVVFRESLWSKFGAQVRYTIVPIIFGILVYRALETEKIILKFLFIFISCLVVLFTSIQLNKMFYFYYSLLFFVLFFSYKIKGIKLSFLSILKNPIRYFLIVCFSFFVIFLLYKVQYSSVLDTNPDFVYEIIRTQIYRIFFAASDGLHVWIDYFSTVNDNIGFSAFGVVCHFTSLGCTDIPLETAKYYLDSDRTSIQPGYLGSAFASYGLFSVFVLTSLVMMVLIINNYFLLSIYHRKEFFVFSAVMFLNSYFLSSSSITVAMWSGGALVFPILIILFCKKIRVKVPRNEKE